MFLITISSIIIGDFGNRKHCFPDGDENGSVCQTLLTRRKAVFLFKKMNERLQRGKDANDRAKTNNTHCR